MFPKQAATYSVNDVLWWLQELGVDGGSVCVPFLCKRGLDFTKRQTYLDNKKRIWEMKKERIAKCAAQNVEAIWSGGPPTNIYLCTGNFLQLLLDRILADIATHGYGTFIAINKEFKRKKADEN